VIAAASCSGLPRHNGVERIAVLDVTPRPRSRNQSVNDVGATADRVVCEIVITASMRSRGAVSGGEAEGGLVGVVARPVEPPVDDPAHAPENGLAPAREQRRPATASVWPWAKVESAAERTPAANADEMPLTAA
jgi:hypothetical protein